MKLKGLGLVALGYLAFAHSIAAHCQYGEVWCDGRCISQADGSHCCTSVCGQKQTVCPAGTVCCGARCCPEGSPDSSTTLLSTSLASSAASLSDTSISSVDVSQESSTGNPTGTSTGTTVVGSLTSAQSSAAASSGTSIETTPGTPGTPTTTIFGSSTSDSRGHSTEIASGASTNIPSGTSATSKDSGSSGTSVGPGTPISTGSQTKSVFDGTSTATGSGDSTDTTPGGSGETAIGSPTTSTEELTSTGTEATSTPSQASDSMFTTTSAESSNTGSDVTSAALSTDTTVLSSGGPTNTPESTIDSGTETRTNGNGGNTSTGTTSAGGPSSTSFTTTSADSSSTTHMIITTASPTDVFIWTRSDGVEVTFTSTWAIIGTDTVDLPSVTATSTLTTDGIEFTLYPSPTSAPASTSGGGDDHDHDLIPCILPPIPICIPCFAGLCFPPAIGGPPPIPPPPGGSGQSTATSGCKTTTVTDQIVYCTTVDGSSLSCSTQPAATVVQCSIEPLTSTTIAGCPLPTSSEEDGMNYNGCDPVDQVQCSDDSCKGRIAPSPVATPGPQCFALGNMGCPCTPSDDTPRFCPKPSILPCDADCDADNGTCRGKWEGCVCGAPVTTSTTLSTQTTILATTTSSVPPSTTSKPACQTNQSCDDCSGEVTDGNATCRGGDFDGCTCTPTANTPGFECGEEKSCELNGCDGTFADGQAACQGAFKGCTCLPSIDTPGFECGQAQSCQNNGCNGRGDGAGGARCQDAFKGCACLPDSSTPGFCSSLGPCSFIGCQGIAVEGQQFGVCQADSHKGCSCILPAQPTTTSVPTSAAEPPPAEQTGDAWMLRLWGDQQCTLGSLPFLQQTGRGPSRCMQTFGELRSWCAPVNEWPSSLMVRFYDTADCTGFSLRLDSTDVGCPGEIEAFAGCTENDNLMSWQVVNAEE